MELLVVLVVVVILMGLLLTAWSGARRKAKRIQCLSNSKQWGLAIWLYAEDHQELFPYEGHFLTPIQQGVNRDAWYNTVPKYTGGGSLADLYAQDRPPLPGDKSLFACPSVAQGPSSRPTLSNPFFMYGFNNRMDPNGDARFRIDQLDKPIATVIFTENSQSRHPATSGRHTPSRHDRRANLTFGDGHAESVQTNDYARTSAEDVDSRQEWSRARKVYWYPFSGAPP